MSSINLKKINLRKSGDFSEIPINNLHCKMVWKKPVDLDLYACYRGKENTKNYNSEGFFSKLTSLFSSRSPNKYEGTIFYGNKGSKNNFPYIQLDQDAGVGDTSGDNEENLFFKDLSIHEYILIIANIYGKKNEMFASYDGKVIITADEKEFTVPLTSTDLGSYCVVAYIDNTGDKPKLINVNKTYRNKPTIEDVLQGN